ncbi:TonB-dependent receptor [Polynucleobacter kasalickyi]|nr:TonB-dependent receptor [Polynucleobacter kasalickyi]
MKNMHYYLIAAMCFMVIGVHAEHLSELESISISGSIDRNLLPQFSASSITLEEQTMNDTVNIVDTPDALKYVPSLMIRKRDSADYGGASVATRIWGISYSAKSIVNVDGVPISNQLYNDNNYGPPRWFMVSPEEIQRIEVMYGPYSAAYSGNSMGAVIDITSKMPDQFMAVVNATGSLQTFNKLGTNDNYLSGSIATLIGDHSDDTSWRFSVNHSDANTQPRAFVTGTSPVTPYSYSKKDGTNGGYYLGSSNLLHGVSDDANFKLKYEMSPSLSITLHTGVWTGTTDSKVQSYLLGSPNGSYCLSNAPCTTFASGVYSLSQQHFMNSVTLSGKNFSKFEWEAVLSNVYYDKNLQRTAGYLNQDGSIVNNVAGKNGTLSDYNGTGWTNADWRGNYKLDTGLGKHTISFGAHYDYNRLNNTQYSVADWLNAQTGNVAAVGQGVTQTAALWAQDTFYINDVLRLTSGLRYESWKTFDGYLLNSSATGSIAQGMSQVATQYDHFSPKLSLSYDAPNDWMSSVSVANAMRFPTAGELYNVVSSTTTASATGQATKYFAPDPSKIRPENVWSAEWSVEKKLSNGFFKTALFTEQVEDALISQYGYPDTNNPSYFYSYWQNVKKVRSYGVELSGQMRDLYLKGFDLGGSVTAVDSTIVESDGLDSRKQGIVGNPTPGVSPLRITGVATYRPNEKWAFTWGGRYQRQFASSIDNNDVNANTYLGFSGYFVMDVKARYQIDQHWRASFGIDNLANRDYFMYHPFPQRTFVANLRYSYN